MFHDSPQSKPSILIKTLPLTSGNYGGVLQAFALQQQIKAMGYLPTTDTPLKFGYSWKTLPRIVRDSLLAGSLDVGITPAMRNFRLSEVTRFITQNMSTVDLLHRFDDRIDLKMSSRFDLLLTGSDQVWRPEYAKVCDYMFEYSQTSQPRIAYAASFGHSDLSEFTTFELNRARKNLAKFSAVSVREKGGVSLAAELGITAEFVLDPTLLVGRKVFEDLLTDFKGSDKALVMVLDPSAQRNQFIQNLLETRHLVEDVFYPAPLISRNEFRKSPMDFRQPSVESWLSAIRSAPLVITDSYHVTLFSILFERDFITLGNQARGLDRFTSILSELGLEDRLVHETTKDTPVTLPIDWPEVNNRLESLRHSSKKFLSDALRECTQ